MADIVLMMPLANRFDVVSRRIPNGLLALAALPIKAGFSVKIIDLKTEKNWQQSLAQAVDNNTLCVGISCSTGRMILSALKVASVVRKINPEIPIVWGGPHPTLLPKQTLGHSLVDIVVVNEGDEVFLELIEALATRKGLASVKGIGYKENGKTRINPEAPLVNDLNRLPALPYQLLEITKYSSFNLNNLPSIDVLTSRGCPHSCGFCSTPVISKRIWRVLSVEKIIENLLFLKKRYGIQVFYFVDDNFMEDLNRVQRFLDVLKESRLNIYWGAQGVRVENINRMTPDLLDKIEASGCVELSIGIESASSNILSLIKKRLEIKDVYLANKKLAGRRFSVKYNMMVGFPTESIKEVKETVELAIELYKINKNAWFPFNIFTPFPGTPLYELAVRSGFIPPVNLEGWINLEATGWGRHYGHWFSEKENELLESINCTSYLAFPSAFHRVSGKFKEMLLRFYQPFAHFRFKHKFYFMHIEKLLIGR